MTTLQGKTVLITGGTGGIGMGMARSFVAKGANLLLTDIDESRLENAKSELEQSGARVAASPLDVTSSSEWDALVSKAPEMVGPIDIVCNNAGIGCEMQPVAHHDIGSWRKVVEVNLIGVFLGCRAVLPQLLERNVDGHIVNTASLSGYRANPALSAYSASKYGVIGLTDALRDELAKTKVGVTVVLPGMTRTNFIANSRGSMGENKENDSDNSKLDNIIEAMLSMAMDPDKLGARVVRAVEQDEYILVTHIGAYPQIKSIFEERLEAFKENADPDYVDDIEALKAAIQSNAG